MNTFLRVRLFDEYNTNILQFTAYNYILQARYKEDYEYELLGNLHIKISMEILIFNSLLTAEV
jgi:hypothetical protein